MPTPPPDCYEDWSKRKWGEDPKGRIAERGFTMAYLNPNNESSAEAMLLQTFGIQINAVHPQNAYLLCESIEHDGSKFNLWESVVKYRQTDSKFPDPTQNPLKDPPRIKFDDGHENVSIDMVVGGIPVLNSAGTPPSSPAFDQAFPVYFTITRNEAKYDPSINGAYAGTVNAQPWSPLGIPMIAPGQAQCLGIMPTAEFQPATVKYVKVAYRFRAAKGLNTVAGGIWDSWLLRFLDQGKQGWYTDPISGNPTIGNFCNAEGMRISEDVALDGTGRPLNGNLFVLGANGNKYLPMANPTPLSAAVDINRKQNGVFLTYTQKTPTNFSAFGF